MEQVLAVVHTVAHLVAEQQGMALVAVVELVTLVVVAVAQVAEEEMHKAVILLQEAVAQE